MRANIVRIGNSQGLRIPKTILQACGIRDQVELTVEQGKLVIEPSRDVRQGWAAAAEAMVQHRDDEMIDPPLVTQFDDDEWEW